MMKNDWILVSVLAFGMPLAATSCSMESGQADQTVTQVRMPLTTIGVSGEAYRLRGAQLDVSDGSQTTTLWTENYGDQESIDLDLAAGNYTVELRGSWYLEKLNESGAATRVDAILVSPNPLVFTVVDQAIVFVNFEFRVGDDLLLLGEGRARIGIGVDDNPVEYPVVGGGTGVGGGMGGAASGGEDFPDLPGCADVSDWPVDETTFETQLIELINQARVSGVECPTGARPPVAPLQVDGGLHCVARLHSQDMAATGVLSHNSSDGSSWLERIAPYYATPGGESLGFGPSASHLANSLLGAPGHCELLMNQNFVAIGVGTAEDTSGGSFTTIDYGN